MSRAANSRREVARATPPAMRAKSADANLDSPAVPAANEHALIIGGTKGAGRAAVRRFLSQGFRVSVIARRPPPAPEPPNASLHYWQADILNGQTVARTLKEILKRQGRLSRLLFFQRYRGDGDSWTGEIETSLTATKRIIEILTEKLDWRDGAIVIVSSINAHLITKQLPASYHLGKAGLNQLARYYAVALGSRNIRVNSISPATFLKEESRAFYLRNKKLLRLYQRMIPLGRMGTADEIAQTADFLSGPQAGFITGQDLIVDGGLTLAYQEALVREISAV